MKALFPFWKPTLRFGATIAVVILAILASRALWYRYMDGPWTRDGRIRADVVLVAADVGGLVQAVGVKDNQFVKRGELLFSIDAERYRQALSEAEAQLASRRAELQIKRRQAGRRGVLDDEAIAREAREDSVQEAAAAQARYDEALAQRDLARLNLKRTEVRAPADGWVANLNLHVGEYVQPSQAHLAVVVKDSFWVNGYFEENRLRGIRVGDTALITLLDGGQHLQGKVESIARGITDRDNASNGGLLADVNPSFSWVRLAQRVPVRIRLENVPAEVQLVSGASCSIELKK